MKDLEKAAMRQALEALGRNVKGLENLQRSATVAYTGLDSMIAQTHAAITALRAALEQPAIKQGWDVDTLLDKPKQPAQQEPVGTAVTRPHLNTTGDAYIVRVALHPSVANRIDVGTTLYTCPAERKLEDKPLAQAREPLTAMEVYDVVHEANLDWHKGFELGEDENRFVVFARAIEAAHGITGEKK